MVEGESAPRVFKLAIAALGGQGGGVLTQWLLDAAEASGFIAQATSVPGVAQRTGATLYYLEFFPRAAAEAADAEPVLALMPQPGDVDLVVASELMEAGRAIQRGLVTRKLTTLVASTHRVFTIGEKSALGDGLADSDSVLQVARASAKRLVALDMEALAREHRSVISSVVLGALAGSGALPFSAEACEQAIRASGRALERNLAAYEAGKARAEAAAGGDTAVASPDSAPPYDPVPVPRNPKAKALMERISKEFPSTCADLLGIGVHRLVDYQNHRYAGLYLDRLRSIMALDSAARQYTLLLETARGLALWMSYEDTARVADLKTRAARFARVQAEVGAGGGRLMRIVDYLSPRVEEICGSLPAWLGAPLMRWGFTRRILQAFTGGRKISTDRLWGYLFMRAMARTRAWRPSSLRHREEDARIRDWLATLAELATRDYELAVEMAACQQLVKGYGETYERGLSRYEAIREALPELRQRSEPASAVRELRDAALADEDGTKFHAAVARL
ncbi:MAG: indolepyruvate oxidoreductase subunit beta family protein [Gammaproteobacteria bacterium]|nr:indolepyruvate oxidoreductase subunit beta family protein [Gammaproteobacteria bacterium]